jgi:hypothetical protein
MDSDFLTHETEYHAQKMANHNAVLETNRRGVNAQATKDMMLVAEVIKRNNEGMSWQDAANQARREFDLM